ncbi:MAG: hypothetical protein EON54_21555, partial [Alcaligenaceae bacterium]
YSVTVLAQPALQTCTVVGGLGTVANANVVNLAVSCIQNATTLSVSPTLVIPADGGTSALTVTNTGSFPATHIRASLPGGWTAVIQDASACASLAPGAFCNLQFSSTQPYVAQSGVSVQGDNTPATSANVGFSLGGFLVFDVTSPSTATVVDTVDLSGTSWGDSGIATRANSLTDGQTNTSIILITLPGAGPSAAFQCASKTTTGGPLWYLPAICQLSSSQAICPAALGNVQRNLIDKGLGGFGAAPRWSSTESAGSPALAFSHGAGDLADLAPKSTVQGLRCVATFEY